MCPVHWIKALHIGLFKPQWIAPQKTDPIFLRQFNGSQEWESRGKAFDQGSMKNEWSSHRKTGAREKTIGYSGFFLQMHSSHFFYQENARMKTFWTEDVFPPLAFLGFFRWLAFGSDWRSTRTVCHKAHHTNSHRWPGGPNQTTSPRAKKQDSRTHLVKHWPHITRHHPPSW